MRRIATTYLSYMQQTFDFFERWSVEVLGYELPQILLLHANELNADHFDDLAEMILSRGYRFVSLAEALEDPAYDLPDDYVGPRGLSWLHRWAITKGLGLRDEPAPPTWVEEMWQETRG